ncbi:hypothetical protein AVEN_127941-1 [Araneus ventricosus]|uniref:Uncharacterized protein n=1 Tax=Araneus ventricosus TaxID=182803 RepID=A0A4Y2A0Y5_ARAVE|nr:hypothetical protein AVEN_127941-1 [Araneus ventricosus]
MKYNTVELRCNELFKWSQPNSCATNVFCFGIAFFQSKIEHFECCDEDFTSDAPSDEETVHLIKEKNDLIDDSSSDMEELGDQFSDAKAAVNILQNFFATGNVDKSVMYWFLIIDKTIDETYLKSRCFQ